MVSVVDYNPKGELSGYLYLEVTQFEFVHMKIKIIMTTINI